MPRDENLEPTLRAVGRRVVEEVSEGADTASPAPHQATIGPPQSSGRGPGNSRLVALATAFVLALTAPALLLLAHSRSGEDRSARGTPTLTGDTTEVADTPRSVVQTTSQEPVSTVGTTATVPPSATSTHQASTTGVPDVESIFTSTGQAWPEGTFQLDDTDRVVRLVDGDLALVDPTAADGPALPAVVVDRPDPRQDPGEGDPLLAVDRVAGVYNGTLIYSDCCAGNVFAAVEPTVGDDSTAESTSSSTKPSPWGVGSGAQLDPASGRLIASAPDFLNLYDLPTGGQRFVSSNELFDVADPSSDVTYSILDATWLHSERIAVLAWASSGEVIYSERELDSSLTERSRSPIYEQASPDTDAEFVGRYDGEVIIARYNATDHVLFVVDDLGTVTPASLPFDVPVDASSIRLAPSGNVAMWVATNRAYSQDVGSSPTLVAEDATAVWFLSTVSEVP